MKIIKKFLLLAWSLFCFLGIAGNYSHYNLADWLFIVPFVTTPYLIVFLISRKKKYKHSSQNTIKVSNDTEQENTYINGQNMPIPNQKTYEQLQKTQELLYSAQRQLDELCSSGNAIKATIKNTSAPPEVVNTMRFAYSPMQMQNDIRILNDCIDIINTTNNLDTFFSRYEQAIQIILTLEQAKQSGLSVNTSITSDYIFSLKRRADLVLQISYNKEMEQINSLKTATGKRNRIDKFISSLLKYQDEFEFSGIYNDLINDLNSRKKEL